MKDRRFDYVIVGAGPSAMGLLLGLLEKAPQRGDNIPSIAVFERGRAKSADNTRMLRHWYEAAHQKNSESVRLLSTQIHKRRMDVPTGQGLGGTSNINAGIVMQPPAEDYEKWPEPWKTILPKANDYIWDKLHKNHMLQPLVGSNSNANNTHFVTKEEHISEWNLDWNLSCAMTLEKQIPGETYYTRRCSFYEALIEPLLLRMSRKKNVEWFFETQVERLIINSDRDIEGVECGNANSDEQLFWRCYANKSVILCTGAIESPALLLASGIDSQHHLNFQGVGRHLQDQILVPRVFLTPWQSKNEVLSSNGIAQMGHIRREKENLFQIAVIDATSHGTILPYTIAMILRRYTYTILGHWFVEFLFNICRKSLWFLVNFTPLGFILNRFTTIFLVFQMHPVSEGNIQIKSLQRIEDSKTKSRRKNFSVVVDVGYLRNPEDSDALVSAYSSIRAPRHSMDIIPRPLRPLFCHWTFQPYYHFIGTCAMQRTSNHLDWVVEPKTLQLRDHTSLAICDASVFPAHVSVPPALTCCALGYALSALLE